MSRTLAGTYSSGIYLTGTADNPVSVTGTIDVASGYAIGGSGGNGETWTIDNAGMLGATDASVINLGSLAGNVANGVVINQTGGTIAGGGYGVFIVGPGTVTNSAGATISAAGAQGVFIYGTGTVSNSGVINAGNVGVYLASGGSVTNTAGGSIYGAGGVWMQQPGTVTNAGTITGTNAGFGAVKFEGYSAYNRLIVDPGAVFNGSVAGSSGVLELARGSGAAGVLYGLGTTITNFSTVQFDPGASWTLVGNAAGLGSSTIAGFNPLATIDLTGFAAVSDSFAYNELALSDGAGSYANLQILGNMPATDFNVGSDGNGGSIITEQLSPGTYNWIGGNGDWSTLFDWDQGTVPGLADNASIDSPGGYTVTIAAGESVGVANLLVGADTLELDGTLAFGTLTMSGGLVSLMPTGLVDGGTIADAVGNGFMFQGGTFNGVTYQGPLEIATGGGTLFVTNGLTVTDATGTMPGVIDLTEGGDASIDFVGSQTLDNVTINLNGADVSNPLTGIGIGGADSSALTIGPTATIDSDAPSARAEIGSVGTADTAVFNQGTIIAAADGGDFIIDPRADFANDGTIAVSNGESLSIQPPSGVFDNTGDVSVDGTSTLRISTTGGSPSISNTGTIALASGATLDLAGWFTMPSLGNLINQGAITRIDGTFDGQGGTLALGNGTELGTVILDGDIRNATILANDALAISPGNASLLNDVYQGAIDLTAGATGLTIDEGVTETDGTGLLPGTINVTGSLDTLAFTNLLAPASAGQTLDSVTVNIGNAQAVDAMQAAFNGGTFTIGTHAEIVSAATGALASLTAGAGTTLVLDGTLSATAAAGTFTVAGIAAGPSGTAFNNNGLMQVGNDDTLNVTTAIAAGGGNGTTEIGTGGVADFSAAVASDQTVLFTDATGILRLSQPSTFAASIGGFVAGDTIDLGGAPATAAVWTAGTLGSPGQLTISLGGTNLATLSVLGDYSAGQFWVDGDGAGGSVITFGTQAPIVPPVISGVDGSQILPSQAADTPFATVRIADGNISNIDTATVTLATPAAGALSDLGSGSYDSEDGVYTVTGTPAAITTAVDGLSFVPAATASPVVSTVTFSLSAEGPGGITGTSTTSLTQVRQFLSLASVPASQVAISSSPNGSSFAAAVPAQTNEALVADPSSGGSYGMPDGYQVEILGGTANAALTDTAVDNAMLVGNSGNDSLVATADNDSLVAGDGDNTVSGGTGRISIAAGNGNDVISALNGSSFMITAGNGRDTITANGAGSVSGGTGSNLMFGGDGATMMSAGASDTVAALGGAASVQAIGAGALVFGNFSSGAGPLSVAVGGGQATVSAGNSPALVAVTGGSALVFGGFGSVAGALNEVDNGSNDTVSAGNSSAAMTLAGSNALVFGGFGSAPGTLQVLDTGSCDTVSAGNSSASVTGGSGGVVVFGGGGTLNFVGAAGGATVSSGTGAATVSGGSGPMLVYGQTGALTFTGGTGSAVVVAGASGGNLLTAGSGPTTLVGGGNDRLVAGAGTDVILAGSGGATISGGSGSAEMIAGNGADLFTFVNGQAGGQDVVWNFVQGQDQVQLDGYASNIVQMSLATAVVAGGSTTVTLPDNTMVTFMGIGRLTTNDFA